MTLSASSFASPSYLFKNRYGVFYFRSRIPKTIQTKYQIKQIEIKKSLRTKDHRQALNYARRMWVQMEDSDYEQKLRELDNNIYDYEENLELQKRLLNRFKRVRDDGHSDEKKSFLNNLNPNELKWLYEAVHEEKKIKDDTEQKEINRIAERTAQIIRGITDERVLLSELLNRYCSECKSNWSKTYENKDVRPIVNLVIEVVGDINNHTITAKDLTKFKDVYIQLPSNRKKVKKYREKSIIELVKMDIPKNDKLSPTTHNTSFNIIITFFKWCSDNAYIVEGLTKSQMLPDS